MLSRFGREEVKRYDHDVCWLVSVRFTQFICRVAPRKLEHNTSDAIVLDGKLGLSVTTYRPCLTKPRCQRGGLAQDSTDFGTPNRFNRPVAGALDQARKILFVQREPTVALRTGRKNREVLRKRLIQKDARWTVISCLCFSSTVDACRDEAAVRI